MAARSTHGYCPRAAHLLPNNCPSTTTCLANSESCSTFPGRYPETRRLNHHKLTLAEHVAARPARSPQLVSMRRGGQLRGSRWRSRWAVPAGTFDLHRSFRTQGGRRGSDRSTHPDLAAGLSGTQLNLRLRRWAAEQPALARFAGSAELLFRFLRGEPSAERDRVMLALLRQARRDEFAGLLVLEALLPGLKRVLGRILVDAGESDERLAVVLDCAWEQIVSYPLERRPTRVAANLLLDIRKQALRELGQHRRPADELPLSRREPAPTFGADIEAPLRRAVTAGAITATDAGLILQSRIDGRPLAEIAAELGLQYIGAYKRRQRAEQRLLFFLGQPAGKNRGRNRHMSSARTVRLSGAGSASGGAVTDRSPSRR